ncbi:MAG: fasciclin domain-containing protein [Chitinophagaceae bacterium]|nr:fasciclin domain-containing protein [Chitinophagaceae bacterium]
MKYITKRIKIHFLLGITAAMLILSSCNKDLEQFPAPEVVAPAGDALGVTISKIADDSLYYKLILRAGATTLATINNKSLRFTMFVPNNAAMRQALVALGAPPAQPDAVYVGFINTFVPVTTAASIVNFNIIAQTITTASIPNTFPNFFYPTNLNPTSGASFNPLVRLLTFPSTRNGNWINNIPLLAVNLPAANGVIHTAAALPAPPQKVLAQRIFADADMTYLAAAFQRADSGVAPTTSASLVWVLSNFGPNVTVFAPTNAAFQNLIFGLVYQQVFAATGSVAIATAQANGAVAAGPAFLSTNNVSTQLVKGIVVYHMLGSRAFLNNFPTTATSYPTLLNGGIPTHPGVSLACTFTGPFVSAATVKGAANATASTILINPTPEPNGTSDQFFVNGTIHKINQVLLPQ